jgi:hypothetical protein
VLPDDDSGVGGVLCRRHADSMIVPRGWTLDDLRDPDLHLFRPPSPAPPRARPARASRPVRDDATGEQLRLSDEFLAQLDDDVVTIVYDEPIVVDDLDALEPGPWTPDFDEADDLDGLLTARSPLLSRAFRTADRPDL